MLGYQNIDNWAAPSYTAEHRTDIEPAIRDNAYNWLNRVQLAQPYPTRSAILRTLRPASRRHAGHNRAQHTRRHPARSVILRTLALISNSRRHAGHDRV